MTKEDRNKSFLLDAFNDYILEPSDDNLDLLNQMATKYRNVWIQSSSNKREKENLEIANKENELTLYSESDLITDNENVEGSIISLERQNIYISSELAEYNYIDQNSKFYNNVIIHYNDRVIKCDNFDLIISENIAIAYNNVTIQSKDSLMTAEKITMNMLTKDISINSKEKIEVTKN